MIYFSDNFNFRKENFSSLYSFLTKNSIKYEYDDSNTGLKKGIIELQIKEYKSPDDIYKEEYCNIYLYETFIHEALFMCASSKNWKDFDIPPSGIRMCQFLYENYRNILLGCREKAIFFIDYWTNLLKNKKIDAGVSFGGNLIYANTYAKVLALNNIPHFCVEHFFTGNDFYFERRYEPIPNNSILQNNDYCNLMSKKIYNKTSKFIKLANEKNKNVKQPQYLSPVASGYILIIAQVCNDFSILSSNNKYLNTIKFYIDITSKILDKTNFNVIIKTHPYEMKKLSDISMTTFSILSREIYSIKNAKNRITIVDDFSLYALIDNASFVITLNSQAGLQAIERFKPVICFGNAFYGNKGFTYDYNDIDDFIIDIPNIDMNIDRYFNYLRFMDVVFEHLIGTGEEHKIGNILSVEKKELTHSFDQHASEHALSNTNNYKKITFTWRKAMKLLHSPRKFFKDSIIINNILRHF